jgi:L-methionine (R)-S-oxide reductase
MHVTTIDSSAAPEKLYEQLCGELRSLISGESDCIANLANASALLFHSLRDLNWAGFYLLKANELVVGPFQGRPACVRIALGRGVCGTAAAQRRSIIVPNVDEFPGHIACDSASKSEIVVPMIVGARLLGVLDVDSPKLGRFEREDQLGLEAFVDVLLSEWRTAEGGR